MKFHHLHIKEETMGCPHEGMPPCPQSKNKQQEVKAKMFKVNPEARKIKCSIPGCNVYFWSKGA
jgi:hypothetical protein